MENLIKSLSVIILAV